MPKYLLHGSYTPEGFNGLLAEGGKGRFEAASRAMESVGGRLEAMYFSLGKDDFYTIVDLPDHVTATTLSFTGNSSGTFRMETVVLLTPDEIDEAIRKSADYRPPGR